MESLIILLPSLIYWCIDEKKGMGLCAAVLISMWIVFFLEYRDARLPFGAAACFLIAAAVLGVYFFLGKKMEALFAKGGFRMGMIVCAAVSFLMILRLQGEKLLIPAGILLGMGAGYCINFRYISFKACIKQQACSKQLLLKRTGIEKFLVLFIRFLLGGTGFLLILAAARKIIPQDSGNINLYNFVRYALSGFWISAASPWIFIRLRLAEKAMPDVNEDPGPEKSNDTQ